MTTLDPGHNVTAPATDWAEILRGFVGIVLLLGLIALAEPILFEPGFYRTLDFHPFWIVVLLAALQHGLVLGVATVVLATLLLGAPDRIVGEDATVYLARASVLPLRWLIVALLVGLVRQAQIREAEKLQTENTRLEHVNNSLAREIDRMDDMVMVLERRAVAWDSTAPVSDTSGPTDQAAPQIAALAAAPSHELPAAFDAAKSVLTDLPTVLVIDEGDGMPLVMGDSEVFPDGSDIEVLLDDPARAVCETLSDTEYGWVAMCHRIPEAEPEHGITVLAFAPEESLADAAHEAVTALADAACVSYDRLCRQIADGADT